MLSGRKTSKPSGLLVAIVVIAALYLARIVFVPLALALLFSLLLTPVVIFLEKIKLPRILAIFLVVTILIGLLGFVGWETWHQFVQLTQELPTYKTTLEEKIHSLRGSRGQSLNRATDTVHELAKDVAAATPGSSLSTDSKKNSLPGSSPAKPMAVELVPPTNPLESVQNTLGPLVTGGVIAIFTIFILMGREDLRNRFIRLAGGGRLNVMTQAMDEATHRINRYLFLQLIVNTGYGFLIGTGLHFIGVPHAPLWGLTATVLRFLPYVGPPMAAVAPIILSLAVFVGWGHALATIGLFFFLELVVSNFVEPPLYGSHVGLSPLAILVAAIFWTLIWGFPGLVLATPLTVCLVVIGRYVPSLGFLNVLLGDERVLQPHARYYQRLLAADQSEAKQILEQYLKDKSLEELYGSVLIPALNLAEQDRHRNELDAETQNFIYQSTREIAAELALLSSEVSSEQKNDNADEVSDSQIEDDNPIDVLCIPARDEADDVVALLLSQLLERHGQRAKSIPISTTADMLLEVEKQNPSVVCISALPPFALNHAQALYSRLHAHLPKQHVVVCLWDFEGNPKLRLARGHAFFTTMQQAIQHVVFHLQAVSSQAEK
jgi:predicted PurR-regulated permease PerM